MAEQGERPPLRLGFVEGEPDELHWPETRRRVVPARVGPELTLAAGEGLDALAALVFDGPAGAARLAPMIERHAAEVGALVADDADFELLWLGRTDWALCDAAAPDARWPGDTWGWRALRGEIPGVEAQPRPSLQAAARSLVGLFEVYPGAPTWVRDRLSGLVLRVFDEVGPWPDADPSAPTALWELRLIPDDSGGFFMARPPIDYPFELLETLDEAFTRRFTPVRWPSLQDLRRARLRFHRAGKRTPIGRMLRWR